MSTVRVAIKDYTLLPLSVRSIITTALLGYYRTNATLDYLVITSVPDLVLPIAALVLYAAYRTLSAAIRRARRVVPTLYLAATISILSIPV